MSFILFLIICAACGLVGWLVAHHTIAKECKNFGKFYVGKEMFHCNKIEKRD
jgi:hypothetical protein